MKLTRKIFALVLCLAMVMGLATTAFAANKITITHSIKDSQYSAYKLFEASETTGSVGYAPNEKYMTVLQNVTGKTTFGDIQKQISLMSEDDLRAFAEEVFDAIEAAGLTPDATATAVETAPDSKEYEAVFDPAAPGYYLIAETKLGTPDSGATDTYSLIMVDTITTSDVAIVSKESVPTVNKKVEEINDSTDMAGDSTWGEHADYDVGDTINYQITGTVSGKYEYYKQYRYRFEDTMSEGLTLTPGSIKVFIGDEDVSEHFNIVYGTNNFTVDADLKKVDADCDKIAILHNTVVKVTYSAVLNDKAVSGKDGNENTVVLKYENDPYCEDSGIPDGETPPDVNIVFTYDAVVNKTDKDGNPLAGAAFTLFKFIAETNEWKQVGSEISGVTTFEFEKLDAGEYKLVETKVPTGYSKADDIEFTIFPVYDTSKNPVEVTDLQVKNSMGDVISSGTGATFSTELKKSDAVSGTESTGTVTTNVVNKTGSELPSTGGVGTTMFYVFGTVMVLGAAVLLITKKRMMMAE